MKKSLTVITILFVILFNSTLFSQENTKKFKFGLYGGIGMNMHNPAFAMPIDTSTANQLYNFVDGKTTISPYIGIIADFPINDMFTISGRIGYFNNNGTVSGTDVNTESIDVSFDANLNYFEISPVLEIYNLLPIKPLYFLAGLEVGIPVSSTYVTSVNGVAINNSVDMTDPATRFALAIGVGYDFEIAKNVFLSPELSYRLPFTNVSSNSNYDSWKVPQLRMGVNLTFSFGKDEKVPPPVESGKYMEISEPEFTYYDENMNEKPVEKITVEEVEYIEMYPFIPYVFFDEGKAAPDMNTNTLSAMNEAGEFNINNLPQDGLKINTYTLDIIGNRLKSSRTKTLTITGTTDSKEAKINKNLSKERAEYCKNYLIANYGANQNDITIIAGGMPSNPSSKIDPDGEAENRRAEFTGNPDLLQPIITSGDKERVASPSIVDFKVKYNTDDEIATYSLKYFQSGELIKQIDGEGMPANISWQVSSNQLLANQVPVDWEFTTVSSSGLTKTLNGSIPVDYFSFSRKKSENLPDKVVSKFSLVLFDFDSPEVNANDKEVLDRNVIPAINANSTVQIYGYTDRIGEADYNKNLANQRAQNVKLYLESKVKNVKFETYGIGEGVQIYNNNLATGRQLSRTVQIVIVTPKNK